ncbi:unnamed protein product [Rotaria sordida]|uniref:Sequestosome-1 n=1 Tax=Rotaria sordida TaxID=392033 RepID=A0A818ZSN9_9BILA|nr:unnamed protein product [Rotaria sordida]CAF1502499.1 unnamed protein product [Rotaria sordida]CAF3773860.1 unnamed protein product [Rotaria sordida]
MATAYYIKAYYTKPNQQQEIRRFTLDISPENNVYNELQTKVASYLPNDQLKDIVLQYTDEENEHITFSSDDELRSAIALNKDTKTLKVYVTIDQTIPQQQQQQDSTTNKECHVGVQCDGCNGSVIGFRYKCFVCPDYDLCEKCSSAGIHSEHNMIRITKPGSFHHPYGHHHHHHHRHMPPPPPPPPLPFIPTQDYLEKIQAQIPQWLPNHPNTAHFRAHMQQHFDSVKANTQTHMQNSKQYLESVGQYLQQALSPFGIDCDYHVDEAKSTTTTNQHEEPVSTTTNQHEEPVSTTTDQQQEEQLSTTNTIFTTDSDVTSNSSVLTQINNNEEQTASSIIPPVENSTKIRTPLEQAIDECMERMKAMGFIDANGALCELIRSKQGDINLVLDAINPRHYQT